jgi:hypothetical protein
MTLVQSHALALFVPAQHCIDGTIGLEADEHGPGRESATAEDSCGMVHYIIANINQSGSNGSAKPDKFIRDIVIALRWIQRYFSLLPFMNFC